MAKKLSAKDYIAGICTLAAIVCACIFLLQFAFLHRIDLVSATLMNACLSLAGFIWRDYSFAIFFGIATLFFGSSLLF